MRWLHTWSEDGKTITINEGDGLVRRACYNGKTWQYLIGVCWVEEALVLAAGPN